MFIEEIILNTLLLADDGSLFVAPEESLQRRYTHFVLLNANTTWNFHQEIQFWLQKNF